MKPISCGIAILAISIVCFPETKASIMVEYNWTGMIQVDGADPWNLVSDTDYSVSILVDGPDTNVDVSEAVFSIVDMELLIGGVAAQVDSLTEMCFLDGSGSLSDFLQVAPTMVRFNGVQDLFIQGINLPSDTFTFALQQEHPPAWGSVLTSTSSITSGGGSSYMWNVPEGGEIYANVVPEPTSLICWSLPGLLAIGYRRRKLAA